MAIDLKRRGFASKVLGVESEPVNAEAALRIGLCDELVSFEDCVRRSDIVVIAAIAAALVFLVLASRVRPKGRHTRERRAESRDARDSQQSKSGARLSARTKGTPRGRHAKQ